MNELERLIATIDRPEPTDKLDACVYALFAQSQPRFNKPRWKNTLAACAAAACIGALGFFAGRQSVDAASESSPAMASAAESGPRQERTLAAASVTKVPITEDQLAGLFVRPDHREGLLGSGPLTMLTSTSP
jgi:hypothetical protein